MGSYTIRFLPALIPGPRTTSRLGATSSTRSSGVLSPNQPGPHRPTPGGGGCFLIKNIPALGPGFQDDHEKKNSGRSNRPAAMCSLFIAPAAPGVRPTRPFSSLSFETGEAAAEGHLRKAVLPSCTCERAVCWAFPPGVRMLSEAGRTQHPTAATTARGRSQVLRTEESSLGEINGNRAFNK